MSPLNERMAHRVEAGRRLALLTALLVVALALAPMVRGTTADIGQNLGTVWPFTLAHCHVGTTPGCTSQGHVAVLSTR